jgi:hypothetical protein
MSTCNTCYGTNTAQPCATVGCLSTNYAKCISYSGTNLFCQRGSIATFTFTGTAVSSPVDVSVTASVTGGNGTDATFTVVRKAGQTTYEVTLGNEGANYEISDVLTIPGNLLGGATPANDIAITVTALTPVIAFGSNLDEVIANINNRLCLVSQSSPSGLDYTAFNYQCLRVGGNLESVGTPITTAQGFTEAVAIALCSLNVRVKALEKPQIIVDSYFGGDIISGTSTLVQILNKYGEAIGDLNDKFTINSSNTCGTFTHLTNFTNKPSPTAPLGTWVDWIITNMCNNFTILDGEITKQINEHTLINTFLYGIASPYPTGRGNNFVNTACLTGGSAQSNIRAAVNLIATELCSLKTTVTNASSQTYTIPNFGCFVNGFPSSSVFGTQIALNNSPLDDLVATTTLQGHLNQIYSILANLNINFGSGFTITEGGCGPEVTFTGGSGAVSCATIKANVDLDCLRDAYYSTLNPDAGSILVRDNGTPRRWKDAKLRALTYGVSGIMQTSFASYNSGQNTLDLPISFPQTANTPTYANPTAFAQGYSVSGLLAPSGSNLPLLKLDNVSGKVSFYKDTAFSIANNTGLSITITSGTEILVLDILSSDLIFLPDPSANGRNHLTSVTGFRFNQPSSGPPPFLGTHNFVLKVFSQNNTTITSGAARAISVTYYGTSSITFNASDFINFYVGDISWHVI